MRTRISKHGKYRIYEGVERENRVRVVSLFG